MLLAVFIAMKKGKTMKKLISIIVAALITLSVVTPIVPLAYAASNEEVIYNYLTGTLGFNSAAACAILGNIRCETGDDSLPPTAYNPREEAWGLCQWEGGRLTSLQSMFPSSWKTLSSQLAFLKWELEGGDYMGKPTTTYLKGLSNTQEGAEQGARYFAKNFERCAASTYSIRMNYATNKYWPKYGGVSVPEKPVPSTVSSQYTVGDTVIISWNSVPNNEYYWINVIKDGVFIVDQSMGTATSCTLTDVQAGSYLVYVSANNSAGTSESNSCTFTVSEPYANLGNDFYAVILNTSFWKPISQKDGSSWITLETETGIAMQKWHFVRQSDGAYAITSCYNGKALEMTNGVRTAGTQISAHDDYWNGAYQQWYLIPQGSGYIFQSKHYKDENWVMDLDGASGIDGSTVQIYPRNNSNAQIWSVYAGDEIQLSETIVSQPVISAPKACFTWENRYGAKAYQLTVWKNSPNAGNEVYLNSNAQSGTTVALPEGLYYAAVETCDYYQSYQSNTVSFTVPKAYYAVSFDASGGSVSVPEKQVVFGETYGTLPIPTQENYTFDGWFTSSDGGERITESTTVSAALDHTLYARWKHICSAGHANQYTIITAPTATSDGLLNAYCTRCHETSGIIIPAFSDTDYSYVVSQPASCIMNGTGIYTWNNEAYGHFSFTVTLPKTAHCFEVSITPPTCTEHGYTTHICSVCGDIYQDNDTLELGHNWDEGTITREPTENQEGSILFVCGRCGETKTESVPPLSHIHNYVASVVQPTCTQPGYTLYKCACGDSYQENEVAEKGHNFRYALHTAPTETAAGRITGICTRCYATEIILIPQLNSQDYQYEVINQPTCVAAGSAKFTWVEAAYGQYSFTVTIPTISHQYSDVITNPTCTENGFTTHTCIVCGYTFQDTYVEPNGHLFANSVVTLPPTFQMTGQLRAACSACGFTTIIILPKINTWDYNREMVIASTCSNEGLDRFTWKTTIYGEHSFDLVVERTNHNYTGVVTSPTCTEAGYSTYLCSVCGDRVIQDQTEPLGHSYGDWEIRKQPTCTLDGIKLQECNRCGNVITEEIQATGHNYQEGLCSYCGLADPYYLDAQLVSSVQTFYASPGATIRLPVVVTGDVGFAGFTLSIISSEGLSLVSIEKGSILNESAGTFTTNIAAGNVNWTSTEDTIGNGELLILSFEVASTVEENSQLTVSIRLKDNKASNFVNAIGTPVTIRFECIFVDVVSQVYGDIDSDGDITSVDAVRLVRYLVDLVELTDRQKLAADVDHDNDITSTDAIKLVRYLVGLVDTLDAQPTRGISSRLNAAVVTVKDVNGRKGELVSVPAVIAGNPGFAGFTFEVNCPKTLELISVSSGTLLKSFDGGTFTFNKNKRIINWTSANNISEDGELFYLTFRVLEDTKKAYPVTLSVKDGKESNFANEESKQIIVNSFRDMPEKGQWAFDAINWAVGRKITSGTTATTFSPNAGCTRAQAVTFLWRMAGMPEPKSDECRFIDVAQDAYYYKAVLWAIEAGITEGTTKNTFGPDSTCTRAQIVTFLWRYQGSPVKRSATNTFEDVQAGAYYEKAVQWATESGITTGTSATLFSPYAVCTRAQIVTFLCRSSTK